jgi:uncharacterized protein (TIGR04255 family)
MGDIKVSKNRTYKKNYLTEVIARIDLVSPVVSLKKELPKEVSKIVLQNFPIDESRPASSREIKFNISELQTRDEEFTQWKFLGSDRSKMLLMDSQFFFISYKKYINYDQLRSEFLSLSRKFFAVFSESQANRFGLRYINQINLEKKDVLNWTDYINDDSTVKTSSLKTKYTIIKRKVA